MHPNNQTVYQSCILIYLTTMTAAITTNITIMKSKLNVTITANIASSDATVRKLKLAYIIINYN